MPPIMSHEFIARSTKMTRSIGRLSASALSHQAADQDADRAAIGRYGGDVVLALLVSGQINIRKVGGWHSPKPGLIYRTGSFAKGTQEAHRSPRCSANLSIC